MKIALTVVASLAFAACSAGPADTSSTTTSGASTTGGSTTGGSATSTTTSSSGSGTTTGSSTTTGGTTFTGPCASNVYTCPAGSPMAGAVYPGAAPVDCGSSVGNTFPDVDLQGGGILNFATTQTKDDMSTFNSNDIHMHDLFCSGFKYTVIDVSGVWCHYCQKEAGEIPNKSYHPSSLYQAWLDKGGTVFSVLVQGTGAPSATETDMSNWINTYSTPYPMSLDTQQIMVQFGDVSGWPLNFMVDLSTMKVVAIGNGDDPNFYVTYCNVLGVTDCPTP